MPTPPKIILDLCGGTGAWSTPYREAGYDVRLITLPEHDVRTYRPPIKVHGCLAAPPCDHFARVGARWWKQKGERPLRDALILVGHCLRIIRESNPEWWALENPIGRLKDFIGEPVFKFDPWWYGDPWTKRTWVWGRFNPPSKLASAVRPILIGTPRRRDRTSRLGGGQKVTRSITPSGFAHAFFEANP